MAETETLDRDLFIAGLDAVREIGGQELAQVLLEQAGQSRFKHNELLPDRIPIDQYLHFRDTALEFLQESFRMTAFNTGRLLARNLRAQRGKEIEKLLQAFAYSKNKLPVIGQAAVLAAKDNPGTVRAELEDDDRLLLTIENCPECRGLKEETPFCYLNQGVLSEFAEIFLDVHVTTRETRCAALGDEFCEIEVRIR
ncbi:MAG TPA: V4R domain-containing protein [Blastocatellia bacterium]